MHSNNWLESTNSQRAEEKKLIAIVFKHDNRLSYMQNESVSFTQNADNVFSGAGGEKEWNKCA